MSTLNHSDSSPQPMMADALRAVLDSLQDPAMASADWLAHDIDPDYSNAADLLSNPDITLEQVRQAKTVFKTMRIVGEKSADRRVGGRMYAAAIAAGIVRHDERVSSQSNAALRRGFQALLDDRKMPQSLRDLAGMALCKLNGQPVGHGGAPRPQPQPPRLEPGLPVELE